MPSDCRPCGSPYWPEPTGPARGIARLLEPGTFAVSCVGYIIFHSIRQANTLVHSMRSTLETQPGREQHWSALDQKADVSRDSQHFRDVPILLQKPLAGISER